MSYCRWSSDNFKSAVYVYEFEQGWTIHVASNKMVGEPPFAEYMDVFSKMDRLEWARRYKERDAWMDQAERLPIGLPHDGKTYCESSPQDAAIRLNILKEVGYHIPDGVIEELMNEPCHPQPKP